MSQADIALKAITPQLKGEELQKVVEPIVKEYFEHGDTDEVVVRYIGIQSIQATYLLTVMESRPHHPRPRPPFRDRDF